MKKSPAISVVMPIIKAESFVFNAIKSILDQSFTDFEFIIIHNGSLDNLNFINEVCADDSRIKLIQNENATEYSAFNLGFKLAQGKYICLMNETDIALPQRLNQQFAFMEINPAIGITGSGYKLIETNKQVYPELSTDLLKVMLLKNNCISHSTMIIRKEMVDKYNLNYNVQYSHYVDYDFTVKAFKFFPVVNMPEILQQIRLESAQINFNSQSDNNNDYNKIAINQLEILGITPMEHELLIHLKLLQGEQVIYAEKENALAWINKLIDANKKTAKFKQNMFEDFLETLWSRQTFFVNKNSTLKPLRLSEKPEKKIDLSDFTFVIPLRVESDYRKVNLETLLEVLNKDFNTRFIILEADKQQLFYPDENLDNLEYHFVYDENPVFHRTKYLNQLIQLTETPNVGVWDTDAIAPPHQIEDAANAIRQKQAVMAFPYCGKFYKTDKTLSHLFRQSILYEVLVIQKDKLPLMYGYYSVGGAFMINKSRYLEVGGENEAIYGWGPEDVERVKRMEIFDCPIYRTEGSLFHLWHPVGRNSWHANKEIERNNRKEMLRMCQMSTSS